MVTENQKSYTYRLMTPQEIEEYDRRPAIGHHEYYITQSQRKYFPYALAYAEAHKCTTVKVNRIKFEFEFHADKCSYVHITSMGEKTKHIIVKNQPQKPADMPTAEEHALSIELCQRFIASTVFNKRKIDDSAFASLGHMAGIYGWRMRQVLSKYAKNNAEAISRSLLPCRVAIGRKKAPDVLPDFTGEKNCYLPELRYVYHDMQNKKLVATNGYCLAYCDMPTTEAESGINSFLENVHNVTLEASDYYPQWTNVVPHKYTQKLEIKNLAIYAGLCKSLINFSHCIKAENIPDTLICGIRLDTVLLERVLKAFCKIGCTSVDMLYGGTREPVVFKTSKSSLRIVLMPLKERNNFDFDICARAKNLMPEITKTYCDITCDSNIITGINSHPFNDKPDAIEIAENKTIELPNVTQGRHYDGDFPSYSAIIPLNTKNYTIQVKSPYRTCVAFVKHTLYLTIDRAGLKKNIPTIADSVRLAASTPQEFYFRFNIIYPIYIHSIFADMPTVRRNPYNRQFDTS